jgi:chromosome segregation ATPase
LSGRKFVRARIPGHPERRTLLVHGKHSYRANISDSPAGTIASLEHALESFEDRLRERETDLTQSRRQAADLTKQLDQAFEHEEKLAGATKRQEQIIAALDITKNQATASVAEDPLVQDTAEGTFNTIRACSNRVSSTVRGIVTAT